jgi:hypothetical protein
MIFGKQVYTRALFATLRISLQVVPGHSCSSGGKGPHPPDSRGRKRARLRKRSITLLETIRAK